MAHTEGEMGRDMQPEPAWLQATATTANTYPKIKRQNATAGHTHNEGPGHAGTVAAGSGTRIGDHG